MKIASLFSGCGGWEEGAKDLNIQSIWGIENNPMKAVVFQQNHGFCLNQDIIKVDPSSLEEPDILVASPPCQNASFARRTRNLPDRPDKDIGLEVLRFVDHFSPRVFILENVPYYRNTLVYKTIKSHLTSKYAIIHEEVVDTAWLGTGSNRKRLILTATDKYSPVSVYNYANGIEGWWYNARFIMAKDLPAGKPLANWQKEALKKYPIPEDNYPAIIVGGNPTYRTIKGKRVRKVWYGPNESCPTLVPGSETNKSMSGHRILCESGKVLKFTVELAAQLQGFKNTFKWSGDERKDMVLIGNSVPPPLAKYAIERVI